MRFFKIVHNFSIIFLKLLFMRSQKLNFFFSNRVIYFWNKQFSHVKISNSFGRFKNNFNKFGHWKEERQVLLRQFSDLFEERKSVLFVLSKNG